MQDGNEFTPLFNIMNEWYEKDTSRKISTMFKAKTQKGKNVSPGSFPKSYVSCRKPGKISTEQREPVPYFAYCCWDYLITKKNHVPERY